MNDLNHSNLNDFSSKKFDEKFSFALILFKLGLLFVSEDSKHVIKMFFVKKYFLRIIFFLESSETYAK